jgi:predicted nucleic acid-binding protein
MRLEELPSGERVFVDANIFMYHFSRLSAECRAFFTRCEAGHIAAFTGVHIVLDVAHRLMMLEALHKGLISRGQPVKKLKQRPEIIRGLEDYNTAVQQIPWMGIKIRPLTSPVIQESERIRRQYGLLTNDSILVAMMRRMTLTQIVTYDSALTNIPDLTIYQPQDISGVVESV